MQKHMAIVIMRANAEGLKTACRQEQVTGRRKAEMGTQKRLTSQMSEVSRSRVPLANCQMTSTIRPIMICGYC